MDRRPAHPSDAAVTVSRLVDKRRPVPSPERIRLGLFGPAKRIKCADGFSMSVQAGRYVYSVPRENWGPWSAFEVGFPSERVEQLMEYAEDPDDPTGTVYAAVPAEVILKIIEDHGGVEVPS